MLTKVGLAADVIECFVSGTGTRVKRLVLGETEKGVREGMEEGMGVGIEVRGRMGRGGLKGSFRFLFLFPLQLVLVFWVRVRERC